jgi:NAD(P)-dependent dehydrogenase (short-subunit alcohol dehydrogenase family)
MPGDTPLDDAASGKRVLVTGGCRGIGRAIVRVLAAQGYDVSFTFLDGEEPTEPLLDALRSEWPDQAFAAHPVDLGDRDAVNALADRLSGSESFYGFVHNAGQAYDALAPLVNWERAETLMQVNFWAMTRLVAATVPAMIHARAGRIVGIGSIAAMHGIAGHSIYAASKGAMLSYLRTLAVELARKGITANCIAPGFVDTDMLAPYAEQREAMEQQIPAGRLADAAEVADLVRYLLAPEAAYITGSVIPVDGGLGASMAIRR